MGPNSIHAVIEGGQTLKTGFAATPTPPYYAVIFTSKRTDHDRGYSIMADRMVELAQQQPGYLGVKVFEMAAH